MEKALLVEDNPFMQTVNKKLLEELGHEVEVAATGAEAIDMMSNNKYKFVLLDCQLPIISGYEVAREVRSREKSQGAKKHIIIACTANQMEGDREECLRAGMDEHLIKPIQEDKLKDVLRRFVR